MGKGKRNKAHRKAEDAYIQRLLQPQLPEMEFPAAKPTVLLDAPQKALKRAIGKQLATANEEFFRTEIAVILWVLHKKYGFGKKRLEDFINDYRPIAEELTKYYETEYENQDSIFFFEYMLKQETGIDLAELRKDKVKHR